MNTLRKALNSVGDTFSPKSSSSSESLPGSLSGCTVTVAQRKVKVGVKAGKGCTAERQAAEASSHPATGIDRNQLTSALACRFLGDASVTRANFRRLNP